MEAARLKIAVVGVGHIGPRHATSVVKCNEAALLCFVDPSPDAQSIASSFNVPWYDSVECMLEQSPKPDAAIVCTPNSTHVGVAKMLLAAGIHVLVEKPLSTDAASGTDLIEAARYSGKRLLVGHHRRFNPYITAAKRALADGAVGCIVAMSGTWAAYKPMSYFDPPTQWRKTAKSGGPILINLIHEIDCLQYLLGPIVRVYAEQTASHRSYEVEEGAAIVLRFSSGAVGTFLLSDSTPSPHFFESATGENPTMPKLGKDVYRIFGTEGVLSVGDMSLSRCVEAQEKSWTTELVQTQLPVGDQVPFDEQIRHFVGVIRDEEQPRCSGQDGLDALVICNAVKQSIIERRPIDILRS